MMTRSIKTRHRWTSLLGAVTAMVLLVSGCNEATSGTSAHRIGLIAPLTGPAASLGQASKKGLEFWVETKNSEGGIDGRSLKVVQCDSKGTPEGASQCARNLREEADVFIAPGITAEVNAVHAQLPRELVLSISPNVTPDASSTYFQIGVPVSETMNVLFAQAKRGGIDHIGILASTDASGEATVAPAEQASKESGVRLSVTRIEPQDVAASGQLTQLKADGVQLIYVSYSGAGSATVVQAYSKLGLTMPLVLNSASVTNELLRVIEDDRPKSVLHLSQIAALVPGLLQEQKFRDRAQTLLDRYQKGTGENADGVSILMHYTGDVAAVALAAGGADDPEAGARGIQSETIESVTDIKFDASTGKNYSQGLEPTLIGSTPLGQWTSPRFKS